MCCAERSRTHRAIRRGRGAREGGGGQGQDQGGGAATKSGDIDALQRLLDGAAADDAS
jgi:hypothetical protein